MLCKVADRAYKARMALLIKNGEIVTADERYVADIFCADETITRIEPNIPPPPGAEVVEAAGKYVFPGGIDVHTHLDMPFGGTTSSDDFETGTRAAAFGGTTTIVDFVTPERGQALPAALEARLACAAGKAAIDYGLHMIVTDLGGAACVRACPGPATAVPMRAAVVPRRKSRRASIFVMAFTFQGILVASVVFGLPFMIQPLQNGLMALPDSLREASYTLGKSRVTTFFRVLLPNIKPSIVTAVAMTFAHSIGEFGIVLMVGGNMPGETKVASIAIYDEVQALNYGVANQYAFILFILSFVLLTIIYSVNKRFR